MDRGDVTFWLTPRAIATWSAVGIGKRRGQLQYSDLAIEAALTVRLVFRLPLRQTEGFLTSIFGMMGVDLAAPDHTTLSRRGQHLDVTLPPVPARCGLHLIVDSTGLSIMGEGEWDAVKHGGNGRRGWKKLHLGMDETGVIVARALTEPTADDATTGISLGERSRSATVEEGFRIPPASPRGKRVEPVRDPRNNASNRRSRPTDDDPETAQRQRVRIT